MFEYRRIEATKYDKDSFISVIPESFGSSGTFGAIESFHPYGFAGRPDDKDTSGACGALVAVDGPQGYAWIMNDGRAQSLLPEVLAGESFQYGAFGNFVRCHRDGRISLFTTDDGTVNGRTISLTIGPKTFQMNAPWGNLRFDGSGFHAVHVSGARIDFGSVGGLPAPLDSLSAYLKLSAPVVHIEGSAVNIGTATGIGTPAARSDAILIALDAVLAAMESIAAAIDATASIPNAQATMAGPVAAVNAAMGTLSGAISAAHTAIPSSSTMVT